MGAACQKQFSNIPDQLPSEYEQEKDRISTSSIKQQHKNFRPNSKNVTMGMIDTIMESQVSKNLNRTANFTSPNKSKTYLTQPPDKFKALAPGRQLDLQQLHATQRPFEGAQTIVLGIPEALIPKDHQKNRELLDFTFYHSLGLEEYNYRPFPPDVANEFYNLPVCEQEIRNGVKYIGEWKSDLKAAHGNGVMQSNTTKYIGQFRNGLKHFHGREIQKYEVYEGQFLDGRRKGLGSRYFLGGSEEGIYDEYLTKGKVTYQNNSSYEGELMKDKYHGQGIFINRQAGIVQSGMYRNGKLHGKGKIEQRGYLVYEGEFEQDLKHGKGAYYWNRQNYYRGSYAKDKKHGYGELRKGNSIYKGMFKNGNMDGPIEVFDLVDGRQLRKNTINFQNGLRQYEDEESGQFSDDGLPKQWREAVIRKEEFSEKFDNKSSSLNSQSIAIMQERQANDRIRMGT